MIFQIAKQREKLLNYMIFLRITPTLPNIFLNLASPIVDIPFHVFLLATLIGLVPSSYIMVRVSFFGHPMPSLDFLFLPFFIIYIYVPSALILDVA